MSATLLVGLTPDLVDRIPKIPDRESSLQTVDMNRTPGCCTEMVHIKRVRSRGRRMSTANARNRRSCIPSFASKVGTISAGSRSADCLHDWRETNPTNAWLERAYCLFSRCAVSKGCRSKWSRNVRIRRFGGSARRLAGRACGRRGLVGERRKSAPGQMSHKAKTQKTANRKAAPKIMQRRDAQQRG